MQPSIVHDCRPSSGGSPVLEHRLSCGSCCVSAHLSLIRTLALDLGLPSARRTSSPTVHFIMSAKTAMFPEKNQPLVSFQNGVQCSSHVPSSGGHQTPPGEGSEEGEVA